MRFNLRHSLHQEIQVLILLKVYPLMEVTSGLTLIILLEFIDWMVNTLIQELHFSRNKNHGVTEALKIYYMTAESPLRCLAWMIWEVQTSQYIQKQSLQAHKIEKCLILLLHIKPGGKTGLAMVVFWKSMVQYILQKIGKDLLCPVGFLVC